MSTSCLICYEDVADMVFLVCSHFLCENCLRRLEQHTCPFCRRPLILQEKSCLQQEERNERTIRVRFRKRRRRAKMTTETINTEYGFVVVEAPIARHNKSYRPKAGKENRRKGRYALRNSRVR